LALVDGAREQHRLEHLQQLLAAQSELFVLRAGYGSDAV